MLTPHECAVLMLIRSAPEQIDLDRAELDTLMERQLVTLERLASGAQRPRLTEGGDSLLWALARKQ
jgi:hypothetical protein